MWMIWSDFRNLPETDKKLIGLSETALHRPQEHDSDWCRAQGTVDMDSGQKSWTLETYRGQWTHTVNTGHMSLH